MQLFYQPDILNNSYLNEIESRHCIKVLRLKLGDNVHITDGKGKLYVSEIIDANPKKCSLQIVSVEEKQKHRNYYLHIAIAPTKNMERFEWFIEKATEIGIDEITPIISSNSERKVVKHDRVEKIAVSAMKQSLKFYLPKINLAQNFNEFLKDRKEQQRYIAHCYDGKKLKFHEINTFRELIVLIGPEGDFNKEEIDLAQQNEFQAISLGENRLRTETAGVLACHAVSLLNSING